MMRVSGGMIVTPTGPIGLPESVRPATEEEKRTGEVQQFEWVRERRITLERQLRELNRRISEARNGR